MRKLQNLGRPLGVGKDSFPQWVMRAIDEIQKASQEAEPLGVAQSVADTAIADVDHVINKRGKAVGKIVYDNVNHRLMVANGSAAADPWYVADGSASVTPA